MVPTISSSNIYFLFVDQEAPALAVADTAAAAPSCFLFLACKVAQCPRDCLFRSTRWLRQSKEGRKGERINFSSLFHVRTIIIALLVRRRSHTHFFLETRFCCLRLFILGSEGHFNILFTGDRTVRTCEALDIRAPQATCVDCQIEQQI